MNMLISFICSVLCISMQFCILNNIKSAKDFFLLLIFSGAVYFLPFLALLIFEFIIQTLKRPKLLAIFFFPPIYLISNQFVFLSNFITLKIVFIAAFLYIAANNKKYFAIIYVLILLLHIFNFSHKQDFQLINLRYRHDLLFSNAIQKIKPCEQMSPCKNNVSTDGNKNSQNQKKIILIGVDSANRKLIDRFIKSGSLPNISTLISRGGIENLYSFEQPVSPVVWTSILTGCKPEKHGVRTYFSYKLPYIETPLHSIPKNTGFNFAFEFLTRKRFIRVIPLTSHTNKCKNIWDVFSSFKISQLNIGWFGTYPAAPISGIMISYNLHHGFSLFNRYNTDTFFDEDKITNPPNIFFNIKNIILQAENIRSIQEFNQGALQSVKEDEFAFSSIKKNNIWDSKMPSGKFLFPDSALFDKQLKYYEPVSELKMACSADNSHFKIFMNLWNDTFSFASIYFIGTDAVSHFFWEQSEKLGDPMNSVLENYYSIIDSYIGQIINAAGDDANIIIVSDHGMDYNTRRKKIGITGEHTRQGIIIAAGPNIKKNFSFKNSYTVLDVFPTLLYLKGIESKQKNDGKIMFELLNRPVY